MKHYFMIFVVLFSALSPQWAGAMSLKNNGSSAPHHTVVMAEHNCCDSMKMASSSDQNHSYCPYCAGDCHCGDGQYCHHISPVASVINHDFQHLLLTQAFTPSTPVLFPVVFISQELRPPQFS